MSSKYYLTLTTYGSDLTAQAHESAPINLKNLVIGDANGVPYDPLTAIDRTHLVNQKASVLVQHLEVIDDVVRVTATVGANIGGFNIHEIGLTDETGKLVYIGNYHGGYKSLFEDGAGGELSFSIDIKGVAANQINLSIDPNINTATQTWVQQQLDALRAYFTPLLAKPGTIEIWSNPVPPSYALECNGAAYSRTEYQALFDVIGTAFGDGDGSTTFNVPDFRAEVPRGWDHGRGVDVGRVFGSSQKASSIFMGDPTVTDGRLVNLYNKVDNSIDTIRNALNGEPTTIDPTNLSVLSGTAEIVDITTPQNTTMSVRVRNVAVMFIIRI